VDHFAVVNPFWLELNEPVMASKLNRTLSGVRRKFRSVLRPHKQLEARMNDMEVHLQQLTSLVSIKCQLPPIPPKHLQIRIAGAYYPGFFKHGETMSHDLESILKDYGVSIADFKNVLDFGCGCGRFLLPMSYMIDPKKLSGTDIDAEAVEWLRKHYACFKDLDVNDCSPPTKYPDGAFDFVYSVSVFTHLPEDMQHVWLKELARIIAPGGWAIFTTHGEKFFVYLSEQERKEVLEKGFAYNVGDNTEGLPSFYQKSFHTHEYIRREWSRYFELVTIRKEGLSGHQDAVLLKKR
jgi:SAM-dependent methyltransferase